MFRYKVLIVDASDVVIRSFVSCDSGMKSIISDLLNDEEVRMFIRDNWDSFQVCVIEDEHF